MGPAAPDNKTNNLQSALQVIHNRAGNTKQIATCPGNTGNKNNISKWGWVIRGH
jgi:hypothetical protein